MSYKENARHHHHGGGKAATLPEAIDLLVTISDGGFERSRPVAEYGQMIESPWAQHLGNSEQTLRLAKASFHTILNYFKDFYKKEVEGIHTPHLVERVTAIMALVTRVAERLEKFSQVVQNEKLTDIRHAKEFQDLLDFYQRKIAPIASKQAIIERVTQLSIPTIITTTHEGNKLEKLFVDLESLKNDRDYELLFIRKEDGSRFFNPRLVQNMQAITHFVEKETQAPAERIFSGLQNSQSRASAHYLIMKYHEEMDHFIKEFTHSYNHDLANVLYSAVISLIRTAIPSSSTTMPSSGKDSVHYFSNFLYFIRTIVGSHEYKELVANKNKIETKIDHLIHSVVSKFIFSIFQELTICKELIDFVNNNIFVRKNNKTERFSDALMKNHEIFSKISKSYMAIAFLDLLEAVESVNIQGYDPFLLQNLPTSLFILEDHEGAIPLLRMPTQTVQERIYTARITQEYQSFLCDSVQIADGRGGRQLIFNFQDRTSWREYSRCQALENLQNAEEYHPLLVVVTQNKESDFYHQKGNYQDLNQADQFIQQLLEQVQSESCGYFYPKWLHQELFPQFAHTLSYAILNLFFSSRNVFSHQNRLDFIEIFYAFMQLKIIEISGARGINFCCKDGIDISSVATVEIFLLLKLLNNGSISTDEEQRVNAILFGIPFLSRGRSLFSERLFRLQSFLHSIESRIEEEGNHAFQNLVATTIAPLFDTKILSFPIK